MKVAVTEGTRYETRCDICGEVITEHGKSLTVQTDVTYFFGIGNSPVKFEWDDVCQACRHRLYVRIGQTVVELRED